MPFLFENLEVYKKAMLFVIEIYSIGRQINDRSIKDQIQRAALSIPLNIAEGQGRMHPKEKRQYYNTARGSLMECVPLIQICEGIGYIGTEKKICLYNQADEIGKMINGLLRALRHELESR
ncbi:MAG: four helix bundle protein [Candidatus Margulisiibacteriota bacterium]